MAAFLAQGSPAGLGSESGDWTLFVSKDGTDVFIDDKGARVDGPVARFRLRHVARPGLQGFYRAIVHIEVDCAAQTIAYGSATVFDAEGAVASSETVPPERLERRRIYAASEEAGLYSRVCPARLRRPLTNRPPPPPMPMITSVAPTPVPPPILIAPPAPPPPPPPPPRDPNIAVVRARPAAPLVTLFTADDYPAAALRAGQQGTVGYRLAVDRNGRVTNCVVTSSSGTWSLDSVTCRLVTERARFTPARNAKNKRVADVVHGRIQWRIPDDDPLPAPPAPGSAQ
jgi:TonB family protein